MIKGKTVSRLGDRGILIEFSQYISENTLKTILNFRNRLLESEFEQKVEITNTYNSLLISYPFTIRNFYSEFSKVSSILEKTNISKSFKKRVFKIPVCYEAKFAPDLETVARLRKLKKEEIIELHSGSQYLVYFTGFLPGFLYLGGMNKKIATARKDTPRKMVERGSVGIAEDQTGVYPQESPGGWQIIGRTPLELFNIKLETPTPFVAGNYVQFFPVSELEYFQIKEEVEHGKYEFQMIEMNG